MAKTIPYVETVEDARVKGTQFSFVGPKPLIQRLDNETVRIYCISCHHPGAFVTEDIPGVVFLCDKMSTCGCDCAGTKGELSLPKLAI